MEWVMQGHRYGCGAACIAMLTGRTYAQVVKEVFGLHSFQYEGVSTDFVDAILAGWGYAVARRYCGEFQSWTPRPFADAPHLCVVDTTWGGTHYVVLLPDGRVFDPAFDEYQERTLADYPRVHEVAAVIKFK